MMLWQQIAIGVALGILGAAFVMCVVITTGDEIAKLREKIYWARFNKRKAREAAEKLHAQGIRDA